MRFRSPLPLTLPLRATSLVLVGALAIAVPGVLALEAWHTSRRHRESAERALRDHATFAAIGFRQRFISRVYLPLQTVLRPAGDARRVYPDGPLPEVGELRRASETARACAECGPQLVPANYFRVLLADSSLSLDGVALEAPRRAWLIREMTDLGPLREARDWEFMATMDTLPADPQILYATVRRGPDGLPRAVYGFAVDLESLRSTMLRPLVAGGPILPILAEPELPNDSLLSVSLHEPGGSRRLDLSPVLRPSTHSATIGGGGFLGGWQIRIALDPRTAPPLLIGGMPPSRTALLALLVGLTAVLIVVTLVVAWRALALARLRAEFVASVSHELRTPLAQILLFGESLTLGRMQSREHVRSASEIIVGEARRLMQLVDNVLLFGRGWRPANGAEPVLAGHALAPLVRDGITSFAPLAATAGSRVAAARIDEVEAPADPAGLRQMLLNLMDNAVKYGPAGQTVQVGLALVGDRARLWVEDEGPGIPAADRERVWQPFVRLERDAEHAAGSGIGLAVVRDLVARHRGLARIEETPAGGARIVIELPDARRMEPAQCAS